VERGQRPASGSALGDADAPDLDLDPADLSSDPFYLDELAHDPLAFTSAVRTRLR